MECKKVHSKLIFFLEKELPNSEMKQMQEHLNSCKTCALFVEDMKQTLGVLEEEKKPEVSPFFYTRVKAKLENELEEKAIGRPVLVRVLQPVAFSIILLLSVYGGIKLGQPNNTDNTGVILSEQQMIPYFNALDDEPIEAFLMD